MSQETLDIYRQHRLEEIENGPFSETFNIMSGMFIVGMFNGVFDRAHLENPKDPGNVLAKKLTPRILVSTLPEGLTERETKIQRESGGKEYTYLFHGLDDEGVPVLWLF